MKKKRAQKLDEMNRIAQNRMNNNKAQPKQQFDMKQKGNFQNK